MTFIYTLELESNKYYVGKTNNPKFRIEQHFNYNGSAWTKKYQPLKLLELIPGDDFDEDKHTLVCMKKYGINNVRGGSFCEINLSEENKTTIQKMINGATNKCYICGKDGHFANECNDDSDKLATLLLKEDRCFRCYRNGHYASDCYAKTYNTGESIDDSSDEEYIKVFQCDYCNGEFQTYQEAINHEKIYHRERNKKYIYGRISKGSCYKCGRDSHYANNCYATTHKNGYYL